MSPVSTLDLRRCALAVAVLHDIDLRPSLSGLVVAGDPPLRISWTECRRALGGVDPESSQARDRMARWVVVRRWLADRPAADLAERLRPVGMPVESPVHPGLDWVRKRVHGDALDIGPGFAGLDATQPDAVVTVPQTLLDAAGIDIDPWWGDAEVYLERMGRMASERYRLRPTDAVRPMGDCDVVTLLGSGTFRRVLAGDVADGMRAMAVPMRTRGWLDLARVDPAFALAAASLTSPEERGFSRPLLVTREEVAMAREGGHAAELVLRDPAATTPLGVRDVLYHL